MTAAGFLTLTALACAPASMTVPGTVPAFADTIPSSTFAVWGVQLFDGREATSNGTVLVTDGRVTAVGSAVEVPQGVPVVDGRGRTLLPSLIDAHVHTFDPASLVQALAFGVTLQLDMFTQPGLLSEWRAEQGGGRADGRADILGAGYLATAPGGHGTQFGLPVPTLATPQEAGPWVAARAAEGADFVKIILEDGSVHGLERATLATPVLEALVRAAHDHELAALVHVSTLADAHRAVDADADGLVHLWVDRPGSAELARRMAERGMFVVPTLTVLESIRGVASGEVLVDDERFTLLLNPSAREALRASFPAGPKTSWEAVTESLRTLHAAGVPIVAGSDAPNPGTTYGASVHRELELLVEAGLSPVEALRSSTSAAADAFGLEGRGRIEPGVRADLVLVEGDPIREITDTRRLVAVWKGGRAFDHEGFRAEVETAVAVAEAPVPTPEAIGGVIPVSDFEDGTTATRQGSPWEGTTDAMIGGGSTVLLDVVDGGAGEMARALRISGEVVAGAPFSWAGAMYMPGARPMEPVDLSGTSGLAFQTRGSGRAFQVFIFTRSGGQAPSSRPFSVGDAWDEVFLAWDTFPGVDPGEITGIVIAAGPESGEFDFRIDRVMFR